MGFKAFLEDGANIERMTTSLRFSVLGMAKRHTFAMEVRLLSAKLQCHMTCVHFTLIHSGGEGVR